jgi:Divergent InlB B-repeat domain
VKEVKNVRTNLVAKLAWCLMATVPAGSLEVLAATCAVAPPATQMTLFVAATGTGSGTITSAPAGISCGTTCNKGFAQGTAVTLTATPAAGAAFRGWSGSCSGMTASTQVTLNATSTCYAEFASTAQATLTISKAGSGSGTVASTPAGINCGSTCSSTVSVNTALQLTATAAVNSTFAGWSGSCTGTSTSAQVTVAANSTCTATFNTASGSPPVAGALYVATTGSDSTGNGTATNPWKTIGFAISKMLGGDTLIVRDGVYVGKPNFIAGLKTGTAAKPTVVMAETPMGVRIQNGGVLDYYDQPISMKANWTVVDGFIIDVTNTNSPEFIGNIEGSFNTLKRTIFKRGGDIDKFGGLLYVGGNDNLVEDVAGVGACRYCFSAGGPDAATQRNIYRRLVGRMDYSNSAQPKATFNTYGNNANTNVRDHLYQNVIALDGQNPGNFGGEEKYGGFYMPKLATNVRLQGSMVLNEGVGHAGMFVGEFGATDYLENSVVWNLTGSSWASGARVSDASGMTVGGTLPGGTGTVTNGYKTSLLKPTGLTQIINNAGGANLTKRMGVSGTRWGEPGYNQLTTEDLWPWPYEAKIREVFREANPVPSGNMPSTNNTKRGFAADGNGLYGGPITLTSYIWEVLGTPCPATVCR